MKTKTAILTTACAISALALAGCATVEQPATRVSSPNVSVVAQTAAAAPEAPRLKRRIAVTRFSNSTRYGKSLLYDGENDPLANQARDMLVKRLVESNQFMVFERDNLDELAFEQSLQGDSGEMNLVGVDAVVIGSVTEFGRKTEGQSGFLSSTKRQTAQAVVEARLVDPRTGLAFFSASGQGEAAVEAGEVAGFGSQAGYDASLNDRAIASAVSDLTSEIVSKLSDRRWSTDILQIDGNRVIISGGSRQGLAVGDTLEVETEGEVVTSGQSGMPITLPGERVASIKVVSFFGDDEYTEGAIASITNGDLAGYETDQLVVREGGKL